VEESRGSDNEMMVYVKRIDYGWEAVALKGLFRDERCISTFIFLLKLAVPSKIPDICNGCDPEPRKILAFKYK